MKTALLFLLIIITSNVYSQEKTTLLSNNNPKVVAIAIRLEGTWVLDNSLLSEPNKKIMGSTELKFEIDNSVLEIFRERYQDSRLEIIDIYLAGRLNYFDSPMFFVLMDVEGKPALFYFYETRPQGGPGEDMFEIQLAADQKKRDDVLYLERFGGSYQSDFAFRRKSLNYNYSKENVVATHLEGTWVQHKKLAKSLTKEAIDVSKIIFVSDSSIIDSIPSKYNEFLVDKTIYLAGRMTLDKTVFPFVLVELNGNPHLVYFREKNGDPMGDGESFNVIIAVGDKPMMDLLFVGGDFNNQAFFPFKREGAK